MMVKAGRVTMLAIWRPTSSVANPHWWPVDSFRVGAATAEQTPVGRCYRRMEG
jgi:hypothetical protein